jgi:hypothetical protein
MSDSLSEAESLCQQVLDLLPPMKLPDETSIITSLQAVIKSINASRKKIMIRSAKGQEIVKEITAAATHLHHIATTDEHDALPTSLAELEAPVKKLEIFWRSFEYATT